MHIPVCAEHTGRVAEWLVEEKVPRARALLALEA